MRLEEEKKIAFLTSTQVDFCVRSLFRSLAFQMRVLERFKKEQKKRRKKFSKIFIFFDLPFSIFLLDLFHWCHFQKKKIRRNQGKQKNHMLRKSHYCLTQVKNCVMQKPTQVEVQNATFSFLLASSPHSSNMVDFFLSLNLQDIGQANHGYFYSEVQQVTILCKISVCIQFVKKMSWHTLCGGKTKLDLAL